VFVGREAPHKHLYSGIFFNNSLGGILKKGIVF
jgi:hypothetical protein